MKARVRALERAPLGAGELLWMSGAYLALALWWLWPLPAHLSTHAAFALRGSYRELQRADWYLIAWALAWGARALVTAPWQVFDANAFHPAPLSLAFSEHFLGEQPLFAPTYLSTSNAVLAVNGLLIGGFTFSALAFYALARRFVGAPAAFVGGFLFSFAPFRHERLFHLHMVGVQYLPLAVLFTERWLERGRRRDACALALSLALQALSSVYLAFALGLLYGAYAPLAVWRWRTRLDRRRVWGLEIALSGAAVVFVAASVPYVRLGRLGLIPFYGSGAYPPAVGVAVAHLRVTEYLNATGVGWLGYALALLALLPSWRGRWWPLTIGVVAAVTGVLVASGNHGLRLGALALPTPFPWLVQIVPPLAAIRLPSRVVVVAHLGLCLLVALGAERLMGAGRGALSWSVATLVVLGLTWGRIPAATELHRVSSCAEAPPAVAWLAEHGAGRPLLELPEPGAARAARRMYLSTCHWLPMVGGYTAYPIRVAELIYAAAGRLPAESALQTVVDTVDVGWIVVHGDELSAGERTRWNEPLPSGLEEVVRFGGTRVFRVTRAPGPENRRARLFDTTRTLDGAPLARLGPTCPGRIALAVARPTLRPGAEVRIPVRVTNLGEVAWPGFGVLPRHLLYTRACIAPANAPCRTEPVPLGVDVPPGETRVVRVPLNLPRAPWGQTLRVELWQLGDGPLEACGVPPLAVRLDAAG